MAKCKTKKMAMGGMGRAPAGSFNPLAGKQIPAGQGGSPARMGGQMPRPAMGGGMSGMRMPAPQGMGGMGRAPAGSFNPLVGKQIPAGQGGAPSRMAKGGVASASKRADGCAIRGKTKGRFA
jgi:hypothetical protein